MKQIYKTVSIRKCLTLTTFIVVLLLRISSSSFAQIATTTSGPNLVLGCGSDTKPFNIEDSTEVASRAPFKFDSAESLMFLKRKGYKLEESYLKKLKEDTPEIYERFKKKELIEEKAKAKIKDKGKNNELQSLSLTQNVLRDANMYQAYILFK